MDIIRSATHIKILSKILITNYISTCDTQNFIRIIIEITYRQEICKVTHRLTRDTRDVKLLRFLIDKNFAKLLTDRHVALENPRRKIIEILTRKILEIPSRKIIEVV